MSEPNRNDLLQIIRRMREECDRLEQEINQLKPQKEWLSTAEFADKAGLSRPSVSVYCSNGRYQRSRKNGNGRWEIHHSELPNN